MTLRRYSSLYGGTSQSPVPVEVAKGNYNLFPNDIYNQPVTIYLPRTQASNHWVTVGHGANGPGKGIPGDLLDGPPAILPPRFSHFQPKSFIPAPRGPHPGISYVAPENCPRFPLRTAPARFYASDEVKAFTG